MKKPQLVHDIVCAVKENCDLPVSVKIRKGWDDSSVNAVDVAKLAEKAGAAVIVAQKQTDSREMWFVIPDMLESMWEMA